MNPDRKASWKHSHEDTADWEEHRDGCRREDAVDRAVVDGGGDVESRGAPEAVKPITSTASASASADGTLGLVSELAMCSSNETCGLG